MSVSSSLFEKGERQMHKNGPMKIFISIPQNGRKDEDVEIEKDQIRRWAEHGADPRPVELIDAYIHADAPFDGDRAGVWYLGESLKYLAAADFVVFATGWEKARGCKIEKAVCKAYNIPHTILEH